MHNIAWEIAFPLGSLALAGGLAWAMYRYWTRNRANDAITDEATRLEYEHPSQYAEKDAPRLKAKLRPN